MISILIKIIVIIILGIIVQPVMHLNNRIIVGLTQYFNVLECHVNALTVCIAQISPLSTSELHTDWWLITSCVPGVQVGCRITGVALLVNAIAVHWSSSLPTASIRGSDPLWRHQAEESFRYCIPLTALDRQKWAGDHSSQSEKLIGPVVLISLLDPYT